MPTQAFSPTRAFSAEVQSTLDAFVAAAQAAGTVSVPVDGKPVNVPYPYPSPADWRDCWIYFLLIDRFNNPAAAPKATWDHKFDFRQGGTFEGVRKQLPYLQQLGVRALWLSPVLKNSRPEGFAYSYPGYNTQDFLTLEQRFASDGTLATAEKELKALVAEAHARGMYVILDIVLNHTGRVFDYVKPAGGTEDSFTDSSVLNGGPGTERSIQWLNGFGFPRGDWQDKTDPPGASADDAIWPIDLQHPVFFRRRGSKVDDKPGAGGFVRGDFGVLRQLVMEYDAAASGEQDMRSQYGQFPVLGILVRAYQYLMAKFDIDGYRIDMVKYVRPDIIATFGNAMREFALSAGKRNFFTFGEIYDGEDQVNKFIGRNPGEGEGFGIDSALDFPLFFVLPNVIKALGNNPPGVETLAGVFNQRKADEKGQISSHGEAGKFFVSFIDNHDQNNRFNTPGTPPEQVTMALAVLFGLQGIPCVYYGTEQGLQGTSDGLGAMESVREALWGKPNAFDTANNFYKEVAKIVAARMNETALRYGRLYFREVSGNGTDFGLSKGPLGVIAFSRVLSDREAVIVANTDGTRTFPGHVFVDIDISRRGRAMKMVYSNQGSSGTQTPSIAQGTLFVDSRPAVTTQIASLSVPLKPWEVQIFAPV